jgi:hypothetical protein
MKRLVLGLAISITTFTIGVTAAMLHLTRANQEDLASTIKISDAPTVPAVRSCFPGLSREIKELPTHVYFPRGTFYPKPEQEKFIVEWYSKYLRGMGEVSLCSLADSEAESYRFLWLRSFHRPVAVRVWRSSDGYFLNVKELSGAGGYEPGTLITNRTRQLTNPEWDYFVNLLERSCYWQLAAEADESGFDGAQWILEGTKGGRYHLVDRWSPQDGDFRAACFELLKLANLSIDLESEDVY